MHGTHMRLQNTLNVALNVQVGMMDTSGVLLLPLLLLLHHQVSFLPTFAC